MAKISTWATSLLRSRLAPLSNKNFVFLWGGQSLSLLGDLIFGGVLLLWITTTFRSQPWLPLAIAGTSLASAVPIFLLGPIVGVVVDRGDKRQILLVMDAIRASMLILAFSLEHIVISPVWKLMGIYGLVFCLSACDQFFNPARAALNGEILPTEETQIQASALTQSSFTLAVIAGPSLATLLFFLVGIQGALLCNAISFCLSLLMLLGLQMPPIPASQKMQAGNTKRKDFNEGISFLLKNQMLFSLLLIMCIIQFAEGIVTNIELLFALYQLHMNIHWYGAFGGMTGLGMLVGAIIGEWITQRIGLTRAFLLSIMFIGLVEILYACQNGWVPGLCMLFLLGAGNAILSVVLGPLVLQITPMPLRGRVWAFLYPAMQLATMIATLFSGILASRFPSLLLFVPIPSTTFLLFFSGCMTVSGGIYALVAMKAGRNNLSPRITGKSNGENAD